MNTSITIQVEQIRGPDVLAGETAARRRDPRDSVRERVYQALADAEKLLPQSREGACSEERLTLV